MRVLLDTNIVIDLLGRRKPFEEPARLTFLLGAVRELELWISASQMTDIFYLLTSGPRKIPVDDVRRLLSRMREVVRIYSLGEREVDEALGSAWEDFEDACLYQCARKIEADAIVTRNGSDFSRSSIKVVDCAELIASLESERGCSYALSML